MLRSFIFITIFSLNFGCSVYKNGKPKKSPNDVEGVENRSGDQKQNVGTTSSGGTNGAFSYFFCLPEPASQQKYSVFVSTSGFAPDPPARGGVHFCTSFYSVSDDKPIQKHCYIKEEQLGGYDRNGVWYIITEKVDSWKIETPYDVPEMNQDKAYEGKLDVYKAGEGLEPVSEKLLCYWHRQPPQFFE